MKEKIKKTIIFDFDGVIIDSLNIKTQAFETLYKKYGKKISLKAKEYHKKNEGISRFEKFKYINKNYLKKKNININNLNIKYSKIIINKILKKKITYGFLIFLKENLNKYNFFISSSSPEIELKNIIKMKKLNKFFIDSYGFPPNKYKQIKFIINKYNLKKNEVYYVGDTINDYEVCKKININFIGFTRFNKIKKNNLLKINNFNNLKGYI